MEQLGCFRPESVQSDANTAEYPLESVVTDDALAGVQVVGPGVGVEAGEGVLGVSQVVPAHQAGEAGLEPEQGGGGEVVERGDGEGEGAGQEGPAGPHRVDRSPGVALAQALRLQPTLAGADGDAGDHRVQLSPGARNLNLQQQDPVLLCLGVDTEEDLVGSVRCSHLGVLKGTESQVGGLSPPHHSHPGDLNKPHTD